MRTAVRALSIMMFSLTCVAAPAWPWGCEGHEAIALIAERHLTAHARRMVDNLLEHYVVDSHVTRRCDPAGLGALAGLSTWADDVRKDERSPYAGTGNWHFIDIPLRSGRGDLGRFCPRRAGCVISALTDQLALLREGVGEPRRRAEALLFVIHLIGDLHQPLHCATNNDLGGNCVPVAYFGIQPRRAKGDVYQPNLHAVWDGAIIERIVEHRGAGWLADLVERRVATQLPMWERAPVDLNAWAWESHRVATETAYGRLPIPILAERAQRVTQCGETSARFLTLSERLGQRYQDAAAPVVEEQLAKAGIRLAMVLNHLWP